MRSAAPYSNDEHEIRWVAAARLTRTAGAPPDNHAGQMVYRATASDSLRRVRLRLKVDLVLDLPEPDCQMGHHRTGVRAATLGYDHGYRLPPPVDRFVDRRAT